MTEVEADNAGTFADIVWNGGESTSVLHGTPPESPPKPGEAIHFRPDKVTHKNRKGEVFEWGPDSQHFKDCVEAVEESGCSPLLSLHNGSGRE